MRRMPKYEIALIPRADPKPGGAGIGDRETRNFFNLGEALTRGREMYGSHEKSAEGFRIYDAAGILIHEWKRDAARP